MSSSTRFQLYKKLEHLRKRPVIAYVTSSRIGASGMMAADCVAEIASQLNELPIDTTALDLIILSNGGDPTVAWRIVSMIRERVRTFAVLVPQAAFSAATLVALGANEIVMHPYSNLGPVDPQITIKNGTNGQEARFGSEDLAAFLAFAKKTGLSDQAHLAQVFEKVCDQVGAVPIGVAARSAQLSLSMGEKLLRLHMDESKSSQEVRVISERLSKDFFHHGYALGRKEAKDLGLKVADENKEVEAALWQFWLDIQDDLKLRDSFSPLEVVSRGPAAGMLGAKPEVPAHGDQMYPAEPTSPLTPYETTMVLVESTRLMSRFHARGIISAAATPNLGQLNINMIEVSRGWETVSLPEDASKAPLRSSAEEIVDPLFADSEGRGVARIATAPDSEVESKEQVVPLRTNAARKSRSRAKSVPGK